MADTLTRTGTSAQHLTPSQVLIGLVEFLEHLDGAARAALADQLPILARDPSDTRAIAAVEAWFVPAAKQQAQIFQFVSRRKAQATK